MFRRILAAFFLLTMVLPLRAAEQLKPYRVLLVISDQWKDPRSFLVSGGGEFQTLVTMFNPGEFRSIFCHSRYTAARISGFSSHSEQGFI